MHDEVKSWRSLTPHMHHSVIPGQEMEKDCSSATCAGLVAQRSSCVLHRIQAFHDLYMVLEPQS
jgi:hypothetical protein